MRNKVKYITKHWPILFTIIVFLHCCYLWANVVPGDEFAIGILCLYFLLPLCGILSGIWYGYILDTKIKWLIPLIYFLIFMNFIYINTELKLNLLDLVYDIVMCVILSLPCLGFTMVSHIIKYIITKKDYISL